MQSPDLDRLPTIFPILVYQISRLLWNVFFVSKNVGDQEGKRMAYNVITVLLARNISNRFINIKPTRIRSMTTSVVCSGRASVYVESPGSYKSLLTPY